MRKGKIYLWQFLVFILSWHLKSSLIRASLALPFHEGLFPPGDWGFDDAESRDRDAGGSQLNGQEAEGGVQVVWEVGTKRIERYVESRWKNEEGKV